MLIGEGGARRAMAAARGPRGRWASGWRSGRGRARGILVEERLLDIPADGRRQRRHVGRQPEMQEDLAHYLRLGDEGEDYHRSGTLRTRQGIEEEDPP